MTRWIIAKAYLLSLIALSHNVDAIEPPATISSLLEQSCFDCHNKETSEGELDLTSLPFELNSRAVRERWVRIHDRVEKGEMPPQADDLPKESRASLVKSLQLAIHDADLADIIANGRGPTRRLTRVEFENELRVLLKMPDLDIRDKLLEDRDSHGFTKVSKLLDMSRVQLEAYLDATEVALRTAMAGSKPPSAPVTQRFTGTDLFPSLETFGEREAMFFARDNRMVPITNAQLKDMTPEQRRDPTLELALFRSATWPYFGYPRGFRAKESGAYRVRFAGRAVRQVRDFRLAPAYMPIAMSFRARQPSGQMSRAMCERPGDGWICSPRRVSSRRRFISRRVRLSNTVHSDCPCPSFARTAVSTMTIRQCRRRVIEAWRSSGSKLPGRCVMRSGRPRRIVSCLMMWIPPKAVLPMRSAFFADSPQGLPCAR